MFTAFHVFKMGFLKEHHIFAWLLSFLCSDCGLEGTDLFRVFCHWILILNTCQVEVNWIIPVKWTNYLSRHPFRTGCPFSYIVYVSFSPHHEQGSSLSLERRLPKKLGLSFLCLTIFLHVNIVTWSNETYKHNFMISICWKALVLVWVCWCACVRVCVYTHEHVHMLMHVRVCSTHFQCGVNQKLRRLFLLFSLTISKASSTCCAS